MNHHAMLLDCTLRDGAYLVDKKFGENNIYGIIEGLMKAKIDCIEIGFFQNEGFGEGKTVYRNSADAKKYIPKDKEGSILLSLLIVADILLVIWMNVMEHQLMQYVNAF